MINIKEQKSKISIRYIVLVISIFFMIYMSSSYNAIAMNGTFTLGIILFFGIFVMLIGKKSKVNLNLVLSVILLCCCVFFTSFVVEDPIKETFIMVLVLIISVFFVISIGFIEYVTIYRNIMYLMSFYSLIAYIVSVFLPSIIRLFPGTYFRVSAETYNLGLTFVNLHPELIRNMGIFWEPGAYQTYLVFAILIEVFLMKTNKIAIFVFFLALLTTWSTTGIINGLILVLILVIYNSQGSKMKSAKIVIVLTILLISIVGFYSIMPSQIQYAAIGKISMYLNGSSNSISASVRFDSIIFPLRAFLTSPILGVGYVALKDSVLIAGHTMTTNTVINWYAAYGTIYGLLFSLGVFRFSKVLTKKPLLIILITLVICLSISTENYLRNVSIVVFILYGISQSYKKI